MFQIFSTAKSNNLRYTPEETKELLADADSLPLHTKPRTDLLKKIITLGTGPSSALAVLRLMLEPKPLDDSEEMSMYFGNMNKYKPVTFINWATYVALARRFNPLIGSFLTTLSLVDDFHDIGNVGKIPDNFIVAYLKHRFIYEKLSSLFPTSFHCLLDDLKIIMLNDLTNSHFGPLSTEMKDIIVRMTDPLEYIDLIIKKMGIVIPITDVLTAQADASANKAVAKIEESSYEVNTMERDTLRR